jgi:hypothetical protein
MSTLTTRDGTAIVYKDWGKGPVVTCAHGWPLRADARDGPMLVLAQHGYRADIASSRMTIAGMADHATPPRARTCRALPPIWRH